MKRNLLIAAIALLAVAFVSCQKDGVYKPKKKISQISRSWVETDSYEDAEGKHNESTEVDPFVAEVWNWADKTVESRTFTTRKVRLTGVEFESEKITYSYIDCSYYRFIWPEIKMNMNNYSYIILKVKGIGINRIFYGKDRENYCSKFIPPNEVYINNIKQNNVHYEYNFNE